MAETALPVVAPKEALAFFRSKGLAIGFAWQDVWQEEHARAFTVAKAMSRDLLEDIRAEVDRAIADGTTLADFRRELRPILERRGWWGRRSMVDPQTGEQKIVQLGSPRRLKTIFEVNMRSAYAAGRWERAQRTKAGYPYLRYTTVGDSRVRPEHRAWDGVIRPIDDAFWNTHYPPCGWNCRCTAVPVSRSMLERRSWQVTEDPPSFPKKPYVNPRSGEVSSIERGIDPGFNFNVGKAYLEDLAPVPLAPKPAKAVPFTVAEITDAQRNAIRAYSDDDDYEAINARLRSARKRAKRDRLDDIIDEMDAAFASASLPKSATVYRGVSGKHAKKLLNTKWQPGDLYVDAGFLSTSRSETIVTETFASALYAGGERIILKILAPEGSRALDIASISSHKREKEILFARSTRLRVKRWIPERRTLELEVLPGDEPL